MGDIHEFRVRAYPATPIAIGIYHLDAEGERGEMLEFASLQECIEKLEWLLDTVKHVPMDSFAITGDR